MLILTIFLSILNIILFVYLLIRNSKNSFKNEILKEVKQEVNHLINEINLNVERNLLIIEDRIKTFKELKKEIEDKISFTKIADFNEVKGFKKPFKNNTLEVLEINNENKPNNENILKEGLADNLQIFNDYLNDENDRTELNLLEEKNNNDKNFINDSQDNLDLNIQVTKIDPDSMKRAKSIAQKAYLDHLKEENKVDEKKIFLNDLKIELQKDKKKVIFDLLTDGKTIEEISTFTGMSKGEIELFKAIKNKKIS